MFYYSQSCKSALCNHNINEDSKQRKSRITRISEKKT